MDLLDNTKEGIIHEGQTVHTAIWLANTLNDYLEIGGNSLLTQKNKTPSSKSPFLLTFM
jgi:hypothetical protein